MCKLDLCKFCVLRKLNWVQFKTTTHKTKDILMGTSENSVTRRKYVFCDIY